MATPSTRTPYPGITKITISFSLPYICYILNLGGGGNIGPVVFEKMMLTLEKQRTTTEANQ